MRHLPLLAVVVLSFACGTNPFGLDDPNSNNNQVTSGSCSGLEEHTFASIEDQPIGQRCTFDVNQSYSCVDLYGSWNITFDDGDFVWDVGDSVGSGTYTCNNGSITGHME